MDGVFTMPFGCDDGSGNDDDSNKSDASKRKSLSRAQRLFIESDGLALVLFANDAAAAAAAAPL